MIGLSPLPQGHPDPFQRKTVRPSSACHGAFSLPWGRSQSFASAAGDSMPSSDSLSLRVRASRPLPSPPTIDSSARYAKGTPSPPKGSPTACGRTVSGSLSLRCPRCFSPFPHGTCALSVSRECLALADGAACFGQGSSNPALLRVQTRFATVSRTGLSPAAARLSRRVPLLTLLPCRLPYNPVRALTRAVWAVPLSLAATRGVTVVFLSSDYWDVSVRRVRLPSRGMPRLRAAGCPIRTPTDLRPFAPPRGLSRPAASFIASGSQGILRTPCLASRSRLSPGASLRRVSLVCRFVFVSAFTFPSCQRTAHALAHASVENVGLEPTTPGLQSRCSSQLSQSPCNVVPGRLELPTPTLSVWCSNRLSYGTPLSGVPGTRPFPSRVSRFKSYRPAPEPPAHFSEASPPERRCSSRTFRYGYLVTT